jgi:hypothetical protein
MTTKTMTAAVEIASAAPRRRSGRPRKAHSAPEPPAPERSRRPRFSRVALVTSLAEMVDLLIKENRQLKRAVARAEKTRGSGNLGQATKALSGLQRRLTRALNSSMTTRRQRPTTVKPGREVDTGQITATAWATVSTSASDNEWWTGMENMSSEARSEFGHLLAA